VEYRGKKLIDQETNTQVYTKNLIIQEGRRTLLHMMIKEE
jgi:hypothetical protein